MALATQADGTMLAAPELGPPLRATASLTTWSAVAGLPDDLRTWALAALPDGAVLLSSENYGILRSTDHGATWSTLSAERAISLAADESRVYAGTTTGLAVSPDGGQTWTKLPPSPLHDLRRLLVVDGVALVAGTNSTPVATRPDGGWSPLGDLPLPLSGLFPAPDGAVYASGMNGLFRSGDRGASWRQVVAGREGCVTQMTFLPDGSGWAAVTAEDGVLRIRPGSQQWETLPSPFGVLPLVALQAIPGSAGSSSASLMAATYDAQQRAVTVWRSDDEGEHWRRGGDSDTAWPVVASCGSPPLLTIGNVVTVRLPDGTWRQTPVGETGFRRVVTDGQRLVALAVDGVWRSEILGATWERDDAGLPVDQVMDIALEAGVLYVLLAGGRLWSRRLTDRIDQVDDRSTGRWRFGGGSLVPLSIAHGAPPVGWSGRMTDARTGLTNSVARQSM